MLLYVAFLLLHPLQWDININLKTQYDLKTASNCIDVGQTKDEKKENRETLGTQIYFEAPD